MFQDPFCSFPTHISISIHFIITLQHCTGGRGGEGKGRVGERRVHRQKMAMIEPRFYNTLQQMKAVLIVPPTHVQQLETLFSSSTTLSNRL